MTTTWTAAERGIHGYADVNGLNLYYETHGAGRPMILLHGGLGSSEMFGPVFPERAARPPHSRRPCRRAPCGPLTGTGDARRRRPRKGAPQRYRRSAAPPRGEGGLLTLAATRGYDTSALCSTLPMSAARDANNKEWRGGRPALPPQQLVARDQQ